jgi:hypothetical protein
MKHPVHDAVGRFLQASDSIHGLEMPYASEKLNQGSFEHIFGRGPVEYGQAGM